MKKEELKKLENSLHMELVYINGEIIIKKFKIGYIKYIVRNDKILKNAFNEIKNEFPTKSDDETYTEMLNKVNTEVIGCVLDFKIDIIQTLLRKNKIEKLLEKNRNQ